jgi:exodeoxyribonuclease VIII
MKSIMIDIETLGVTPDSTIIQIAAVRFSLEDASINDEFSVNISPASCKALGLITDKKTIEFWKNQPTEVIRSVMSNQTNIENALTQLNNFIGGYDKNNEIWANGTVFDISMLEWSYRRSGIECPWRYFQIRDVRTIFSVAKFDWRNFPRIGMQHNALGDCHTQIAALRKILLE